MYQYNQKFRLNQAMTLDVGNNLVIWRCPGIHFDSADIPKELVNPMTFVIKWYDAKFNVGVEGMSKDGYSHLMISLADFSSLEELQKNSPHLFEIDGELNPI